jgi:hypothetical protein
MDHDRVENSWTIPGTPGRQIELIASATDGREDDPAFDVMQVIELLGPSAHQTVHADYAVYLNGPGWQQQLRAALAGGSVEMAVAYIWWTRHRDTAPYAGYRLLTAFDRHGPCAVRQVADPLRLRPTDVGYGLYGRALQALGYHNLVQVYRDGRYAITPAAEEVIRPGRTGGTWPRFRQAMQAALGRQQPGGAIRPATLAKAFETPGQPTPRDTPAPSRSAQRSPSPPRPSAPHRTARR